MDPKMLFWMSMCHISTLFSLSPKQHISSATAPDNENILVVESDLRLSVSRIWLATRENVPSGPSELDQVQDPDLVSPGSLAVRTTEDDHTIPDHGCAMTRDGRRRIPWGQGNDDVWLNLWPAMRGGENPEDKDIFEWKLDCCWGGIMTREHWLN